MGVSLLTDVSVLNKLQKNQGNVAISGLPAAAGARQWK